MALDREDKVDVKHAMGSRMANKVAKVTRDSLSPEEKMKVGVKLMGERREKGQKSRGVFSRQLEERTFKAHEKKREMAKKMSSMEPSASRKKEIRSEREKLESESRYGKGHTSMGLLYK